MFLAKVYFLSLFLNMAFCNWVSDWMRPVQEELTRAPTRKNYNNGLIILDDDQPKMGPAEDSAERFLKELNNDHTIKPSPKMSLLDLKTKLANTLQNAKMLADDLKKEISSIATKEKALKEAIASGRAGLTTVTVTSLSRLPRTYMITDGFWSICNGVIQNPSIDLHTSPNPFNEVFAPPRCMGQLVSSIPDPCVFNSIIKYETVPQRRALEYYEDDYLCLKPNFNNSIEQYLSVPKHVVNNTCKNGIVKSITDNINECGIRTMAEYNYYPQRSYSGSFLPLEYCEEQDGACKLIVGWHITNASIENFEFLKNEPNFKKFFLNAGSAYNERGH